MGSGSIVSQLAQERLIDEYQIVVCPVVLGKGRTPAVVGDGQAQRTAELVARRSYGKLVAILASRTRDVAAAEDALSEAFASSLAIWPLSGCPPNPEAWLVTVALRAQRCWPRQAQNTKLTRPTRLGKSCPGWDSG